MRDYYAAVTFVICQHRGASSLGHVIDLLSSVGSSRESERHEIPISPRSSPYPSYTYGISSGISVGPYRNTQSICMPAHTYVRGACNTWYNTRDESALYQKIPPPGGCTHRVASTPVSLHVKLYYVRVRVTVIHDGILYTRSVHRLPPTKWRPENYVGQIDDCNRILINSTRDSVWNQNNLSIKSPRLLSF